MYTLYGNLHSLRILVVDDKETWADLIKSDIQITLECHVHIVTDLNSAMHKVVQWKPHIIFLDIHIPLGDWKPVPKLQTKYDLTQQSFAFCEQVVSSRKLPTTFLIMMSVDNQEQYIALAKKAGARHYFDKSENFVEFFEGILKRYSLNVERCNQRTDSQQF